MNHRRQFLSVAALAACLALSPVAMAGSAEDFVKAKQSDLTALIKAGAPDAKVDKAFDQVLDYPALAESSLRDHWSALDEAQRKDFIDLFSRVVRKVYRRNLKKTLGYEVEYKGSVKGEAGDVVRTVAKSKTNTREEPLSIDYVVRGEGSGQRIIDIFTEGSSLVGNYRSSFNRVMKKHGKNGFAEVMKGLRKKLDAADPVAEG